MEKKRGKNKVVILFLVILIILIALISFLFIKTKILGMVVLGAENNSITCADGIDNDGDNLVDFAEFKDCSKFCRSFTIFAFSGSGPGFVWNSLLMPDGKIYGGCCTNNTMCFVNSTCYKNQETAKINNTEIICSVKGYSAVWCKKGYINDGIGYCIPEKSNCNERLIRYWSLDNKTDILESCYDYKSYLVGDISIVNGTMGKAFNFSNSKSYLNLDSWKDLILQDQSTISFWIKLSKRPNEMTAPYPAVLEKSGSYLFYLAKWNNGIVVKWNNASGSVNDGSPVSNTKFEKDKWYHIVWVFNGTSSRLYINGTLDSSKSFPKSKILSSQNQIRVSSSSQPFDGIVDEIRIYNKSLNSSDINLLYHFEVSSSDYAYYSWLYYKQNYLMQTNRPNAKTDYNPNTVCCVTGSSTNTLTKSKSGGLFDYCIGGSLINKSECIKSDNWYKTCDAWGATPNWIALCSSCISYGLSPSNEHVSIGPRLQAIWDLCGDYIYSNSDDPCLIFKKELCCGGYIDPPPAICGEIVCGVISTSKKSLTKSKTCCPDSTRWEECNGFCCDKRYEECVPVKKLGIPIPGTQHCAPSDKCEKDPNKKLCPAKFPKCCNKDDMCGKALVDTPVGKKETAVCLKPCAPGETICDTENDGKNHCCKPPNTQCVVAPDLNIKICMPPDDGCKDDPEGNTELCKGEKGQRCCKPGTCFVDNRGIPRCDYQSK